jgi:hypothetical protein
MTKTEIKATSGRIERLSENTGVQKVEAGTWSARSITVRVAGPSRGERVASINDRLRGSAFRNVNTAD